jgi:tRNA (guanine37-N1)-methyltransferase
MSLRIDILTLFPSMFEPVLGASILGRARGAGLIECHVHDVRQYTEDKHKRVDDRPFGGGPGMVMMCQPLFDCVRAVEAMDPRKATRILLTPQGEKLSQPLVEVLSKHERLLLIAGHYEGIDERVVEELNPLQVSVGDFVVSGGEIPAMMVVDAVTRLLPGALGDEQSASEDSFSPADLPLDSGGEVDSVRLLDCAHYTRPREWRGRAVPEVLLSGDHQSIARWRLGERIERTRERRPDLLEQR